jgi:hypothetical protein
VAGGVVRAGVVVLAAVVAAAAAVDSRVDPSSTAAAMTTFRSEQRRVSGRPSSALDRTHNDPS